MTNEVGEASPGRHWPIRLIALALWSATLLAVVAVVNRQGGAESSWDRVFDALVPTTAGLGALVWWQGHRWGRRAVFALLLVLDALLLLSVLANHDRRGAALNLFLLLSTTLYASAFLDERLARVHEAVIAVVVITVTAAGVASLREALIESLIPLTGLLTASELALYQKRSLQRAMVEVERVSVTDPLTGALNRRGLDRELADGPWRDGALLVFDLDRFKEVNDAFGHATGDEVLVATVQALQSHVRAADLVVRTGGEEFVVVLRDAGPDLPAVAERLRVQVSRVLAPWEVTISAGATRVGVTEDLVADLESVTVRADRALYEAKAAGRDTSAVA